MVASEFVRSTFGVHPLTRVLKWSWKFGQTAKVYPEPLKGYRNGETPELYGRI